MRLRKLLLCTMAGLLCLSMTSCAAIVAGGAGAAAAYTYISGWLGRDYDASLADAYQASLDALEKNKINVVEKNREMASATIKAESEKQTYWIKLESKGEKLTNVAVRAGLIGDEAASKKLHRDIEANL